MSLFEKVHCFRDRWCFVIHASTFNLAVTDVYTSMNQPIPLRKLVWCEQVAEFKTMTFGSPRECCHVWNSTTLGFNSLRAGSIMQCVGQSLCKAHVIVSVFWCLFQTLSGDYRKQFYDMFLSAAKDFFSQEMPNGKEWRHKNGDGIFSVYSCTVNPFTVERCHTWNMS